MTPLLDIKLFIQNKYKMRKIYFVFNKKNKSK